ncbi:MAG: hypothetical protein ACRBDI_03170 [Alphaproteobacteria bacterium]
MSNYVKINNNLVTYSEYKPDYKDANSLTMADTLLLLNLNTDIVDLSEEAEDAFIEINEDLQNENARALSTVNAFHIAATARINERLAELNANNAAASVIADWTALGQQLDAATRDMIQTITSDKTNLNDDFKKRNAALFERDGISSSADSVHESLQDMRDDNNDNDKGRAAAILMDQAARINQFGHDNVKAINDTNSQAHLIMDQMKAAMDAGKPLIVAPSMSLRGDVQLSEPEMPDSFDHAKMIFSQQSNHTSRYFGQITAYYTASERELTGWHNDITNELTIKLNSSAISDEDKDKYRTIKDQIDDSYDEALQEIKDKRQEFDDKHTELTARIENIKNDIQSNPNASPDTYKSMLDMQHGYVNAFLGEQVDLPKTFIPEMNKNIIGPYRRDITNVTPADNAYALHGAVAPPPPPPVIPTAPTTAPTDQTTALAAFNAEKMHLGNMQGDIEKSYSDLRTRVANEAKALNAELDSRINLAGISPEEKARFEKIKANLAKSVEEINDAIDEKSTAYGKEKADLTAQTSTTLQNLNSTTLTASTYAKLVSDQHNRVVDFLNTQHGVPAAIEANLATNIVAAYTNDIASADNGTATPDDPHSLGTIAAVVPPATAPVSAAAGGTTPAVTGTIPPTTSTTTTTTTTVASTDPAVNDARTEAMKYREDVMEQYVDLQKRLDSLKKIETTIREDSMPRAERQHEAVDSTHTEEGLAKFKCYHEELQNEIKMLEAAKGNPVWKQAGELSKKINESTNAAEITALGAQLKPYATSTKNLTESAIAQNDAFIDKYDGDRFVDYYMGGEARGDEGLVALSGGRYGAGNQIFGSDGPGVQSYGGGLVDGAVGTVQSWASGYGKLKRDAGRYGTQGEQNTLNWIENGAFALGSLWALKHGMNMAGIDNKLLRGAVMVGVIGFFIHRTGKTGQEMHDYGKVRNAMQSEGYGRNLPTNLSDATPKDLEETAQELADATGKSKAEIDEMVKDVQETMENSGNEFAQSEKGEIPKGADNNEESSPVSQGGASLAKELADTKKVVDPSNGADAANDDPTLNAGMKAS